MKRRGNEASRGEDRQKGSPDGRTAALRVLAVDGDDKLTAAQRLEELARHEAMDGRELGLATELVMGVLRHRLTLIRVLGMCMDQGWKRIDRKLRPILLLGAYQLIWLDQVPAFAAVSETVEQAKRAGGIKAGRFVNAVLRRLLREIDVRRLAVEQADAQRAIPVDAQMCCQFHQQLFPDRKKQPAEFLAEVSSHPLWLVKRWVAIFGPDRAGQICTAGMHRPVLFLRPNRIRISAAAMVGRLADEGYQVQLTEDEQMVAVESGPPIGRSPCFADGLCQPQDPTATLPVAAMKLQVGQTVLDLCAGLGTKSTQAAEAMDDAGTVLACDKDRPKLLAMADNARRLGLNSIRLAELSELEQVLKQHGRVDWILVDAPCSNSGVLGRRPEARYRLEPKDLEGLSVLQLELLERAASLAGPQTRICYSTCSLEPEENEQAVENFARTHPDWRLTESRRTFPERAPEPENCRDGGFYAIWVRK